MGVFRLWCLLLCATAGTAHSLEKRAAEVDQECLPKKLGYPRIKLLPFGITVHWKHFEPPKSSCVLFGAKYVVNVTWTVGKGDRQEKKVSVKQDSFDIGGLSPWTDVDLLVSLCYIDKNGYAHCGESVEWNTKTSESNPSEPISFRVFKANPNATTFLFEDPQRPNGPLDGYMYEVCKVKSCDDVVARRHCGIIKELEGYRHERTFQVGGMAPLEYYKILLWAYNKDYITNRILDGDSAELCPRAPPSALEPIRDFSLRCSGEQGTMKVTWKLPSHNIPEDYQLAIQKVSTERGEAHGVKWDRHDVNIKTWCQGDLCSYTMEGRGGKGLQIVEFSPIYKDVGPLQSYTLEDECFFPPPPPVKEIQVADDPGLDKTQQAIEIPADLFSDFKVTLGDIELLVAQDSQIGDCDHPKTWHEAHSHDPISCYSFPLFHENEFPRTCNRAGHVIQCVLGTRQHCARCDGPLKLGVKYGVKLRAKAEEGYVDSKTAFFTAGSTSGIHKWTQVSPSTGSTASTTDEMTTVQEVASSTAGTQPSAAPPPPVKEIQVVDDFGLDKTQQTIEIPAELFSEFNVTLNETEFLVAQDSQIGDCDHPETWHEAHSHDPISCYSFPLFHENEFLRMCNETGHIIQCVLGTRQHCARCDGPLKLGVKYGIKLRATTEEGYVDSKTAFFTAGSTSGGTASTTGELTTVQEVASSTAGTPPGAGGTAVTIGGSSFLLGGIVALTALIVRV